MSSLPPYSLQPHVARAIAQELERDVMWAVDQIRLNGLSEDDATGQAVGAMSKTLRNHGLPTSSWQLAQPNHRAARKQSITLGEWHVGADIAFLFFGQSDAVVRAALVQAKRISMLDAGEWKRLVGQCSTMEGGLRDGGWVWVYELPEMPLTVAFTAANVVKLDGARTPSPLSSLSDSAHHFTSFPPAHDLESWFYQLLMWRSGQAVSGAIGNVRQWLTERRPARLMVTGPNRPEHADEFGTMLAELYDPAELDLGPDPTRFDDDRRR